MAAKPISIEFNDKKVQRKLQKLSDETGVSIGFIAEDQMRLWVNDIMRKAQPKTLKEGRARIEKDVSRLFTPIDNPTVLTKWKEQAVERGGDIFTQTKRGKMRVNQKQLKFKALNDMERIHRKNRTSKGGVKKTGQNRDAWGGEGLVPRALFKKFMRTKQKKVGFLKSRFGKAAIYYASRTRGATKAYSNWIRRHIPGGSFAGKIDRSGNGFISAINDASFAGKRLLGESWWTSTMSKRQRDLVRGGFKRMSDLTRRFNSG